MQWEAAAKRYLDQWASKARFPPPSCAVPSHPGLPLQQGWEDGSHLLGKSAHSHRVGRVRTLGVPRLGFSSPKAENRAGLIPYAIIVPSYPGWGQSRKEGAYFSKSSWLTRKMNSCETISKCPGICLGAEKAKKDLTPCTFDLMGKGVHQGSQ